MGHTGVWWWPIRVSCRMLLWVHSWQLQIHLPLLWQLLRFLGTELDLMPSGHQTRLTEDKATYMGPADFDSVSPVPGRTCRAGVQCS